MAQKILGLEIEAQSIRGVVIEAAYRGVELHAAQEIPIEVREPEEGEEISREELQKEAFDGALRQFLEELGTAPDVVSTALPGPRAASSILTLPFSDTKKIEATLGFEVESLLPFDLDEVIYDYQILSRSDGTSELVVGVAREEELVSFIDALAAASLDPRVVTLPGLGLFSLVPDLFEEKGVTANQSLAVVDLGRDRTVLAVAKGAANARSSPSLVFHRALEAGTGDLPVRLSKLWGVSPEEAAGRLAEVNLGDETPESKEVAGALGPVVRQLRQTFHAVIRREGKSIDGIMLVGAASGISGIGPWLSKETGLHVEVVDTVPGAQQLDPSYSQAFGLALRGLKRGRGLLNLRKGALAFHGDMGYLREKLPRLAAFAALFFVLLSLNAWTRLATVSSQETDLDEALCSITTRVLGSCETDYNIALAKLKGGDTKGASVPSVSALEVFSVATNQISDDVGLEVKELEATLGQLRLSGTVDSFEGVEQVEAALRRSPCIGEIRQGRVQKNRDDKVELTLDASYVCGQAPGEAG